MALGHGHTRQRLVEVFDMLITNYDFVIKQNTVLQSLVVLTVIALTRYGDINLVNMCACPCTFHMCHCALNLNVHIYQNAQSLLGLVSRHNAYRSKGYYSEDISSCRDRGSYATDVEFDIE